MAVSLKITQEQAEVLTPLLTLIQSSDKAGTSACLQPLNSDNPDDDATIDSGNEYEFKYSLDELLEPKRGKSKSTDAHNYFHVSVT